MKLRRITALLFILTFAAVAWFAFTRDSFTADFPAVNDNFTDLLPNITIKIGESMTLELVRIPPGSLKMGTARSIRDSIPLLDAPSDAFAKPSFHATVTKGYYIGKDNISTAEYAAFLNATDKSERSRCANLKPDNKFLQFENLEEVKALVDEPVDTASWPGAVAFCKWLSTLSAMEFRLPTEAEWELAARGNANAYDRVWAAKDGGNFQNPGPVAPNRMRGLATGYLGNWCSDRFDYFTPEAKTDPKGPGATRFGDSRVLRRPIHTICDRNGGYHADDGGIYGFRVVLSEDSVKKMMETPGLLPDGVTVAPSSTHDN